MYIVSPKDAPRETSCAIYSSNTLVMRLPLACALVCILFAVTGASVHGSGIWIEPITPGAWGLEGSRDIKRWLIVHAVPSRGDPNFHIEVLQAKSHDPVWRFDRLAAHMAISEGALRRSIVGPSTRRNPYPEAYEFAYKSWLESARRETCATTVAECLMTSGPLGVSIAAH